MWVTLRMLSVIIGSIVHCAVSTSEPGGPCTENTESGDCIPLNRCRPIQLAIIQKKTTISSVTCRIDSSSPLPFVCCPNGKPPKTKLSDSETISITKDAPAGSRISVQKCYEYAKGVYQREKTFALFDDLGTVDKCVKIAESLIVNGEPTKKGEFPHMALLGYGKDTNNLRYDCGGSLVSEKFVLTAAHCGSATVPSYVLLGEYIKGTNSDGADTQLILVQNFIEHPQYQPPAHYFDLALIRLSTKATLTPYVRPACLHSDQPYDHRKVTATGWGQLEYLDERTSDILFKVDLNEVNGTYCERAHSAHIRLPRGYLPDQQMCVGKLEGGKDTCQGDSGGPLQVTMTEPHCSYLIIGVTSFGKGCALAKTPGVYARVKKFIKWLEDTIWAPDDNNTGSNSKKASLVNSATVDNNTPKAKKAGTVTTDNKRPVTNIKYKSTVHVLVKNNNNTSQYTYETENSGLNPTKGFSGGNFNFNFTPIAGFLSSISSQIPVDFPGTGNENIKFNLSSLTGLLSSLNN